jgi:hypothetical protein
MMHKRRQVQAPRPDERLANAAEEQAEEAREPQQRSAVQVERLLHLGLVGLGPGAP